MEELQKENEGLKSPMDIPQDKEGESKVDEKKRPKRKKYLLVCHRNKNDARGKQQ